MKQFLFAALAAMFLASCAMSNQAQPTVYQVKHGKVTKLSKGQTPDCIRNW